MLEHAVDQQRGLLLHLLGDGVGHAVVRLQAGLVRGDAVFIVHVLLGRPVSRSTQIKAEAALTLPQTGFSDPGRSAGAPHPPQGNLQALKDSPVFINV